MELFRIRNDIPFMRHALAFNVISLITFILAVFFLATKGLHFGVEFTGGTVMEVNYGHAADMNKHSRQRWNACNSSDATVQSFGSSQTALIRLPARQDLTGAQLSEVVIKALREDDPTVELRRVDFVGSQVGKELVENGALALLLVSIGIVVYLAMRFEWKFGVSAIIANLHDVVIILGFFAFFQWEFSLPVLAAVLAVLGYSVNESVVVFDRIRENFRKMRKATTPEIINNAITRTMSRTIITHGCYPVDGDLDAVFRRRNAALFCAGAHHRHSVRNLFFGAGGKSAGDVAGCHPGRFHQAREKQEEAVV